jgi:serine/threonine protein kinase
LIRFRSGARPATISASSVPEAFALHSDRLARFKREAQVLASLNHANIAAIYGFEDSNGVQALVLELVEGSTLPDRIAQGPVPLDEALHIARQVTMSPETASDSSFECRAKQVQSSSTSSSTGRQG